MKKVFITIMASLLLLSCHKTSSRGQTHSDQAGGDMSLQSVTVPSPFSADSAYNNIKMQVDLGPRVPNTASHRACADLLESRLRQYSLKVYVQEADLKAYDGTILKSRNIIGVFNPEAKQRILLFAHWDTRPYADHDADPAHYHKPIDGADDGGSGVGVLLEIARILQQSPLSNIGIDIALFDAEDYGIPDDKLEGYEGSADLTWALGTQYWTRHPHVPGYTANFGILLDMVGAKDATFYREYYSQQSAGKLMTEIWALGKELGYDRFFINEPGGAITDDHIFVIRNMAIPCVDILNYKPDKNSFAHYWHTMDDNMEVIDKTTLEAVGVTLWSFLEKCNAGEMNGMIL